MSNKFNHLFNLRDSIVVVTGGLGYLGSQIVIALLEFGAKVTIFDNSKNVLNLGFEVNTNNRLLIVNVDLSDPNDIRKAFGKVEKHFGVIDALVNCAAYGNYAGTGSIENIPYSIWDEGIEGTLGITFKSIKESIPFIKKSINPSIVNFGSLYSWIAPDLSIYENDNGSPPNYGSGKAGIIQLTRHAASEFSKYSIRVNSVTPGSFPHPKTQQNTDFIDRLSKRNMLNRIGYPNDLVGPVLFLISRASLYITGTNINVDGGQLSW